MPLGAAVLAITKVVGMTVVSGILSLALLVGMRSFIEARYVIGAAMAPTLGNSDRLFIEKISAYEHKPLRQGQIVVFYQPEIISSGSNNYVKGFNYVCGQLTGLPIFPQRPANIKRIIGLPGDAIKVESGTGVYINGQLLDEPYVTKSAGYSLIQLSDIGGCVLSGQIIRPYEHDNGPIIVPPGKVFVLGDNRDCSMDSHVYGFVDQDKIIGRFFYKISVKNGIPEIDWHEATKAFYAERDSE